VTDGPTDGRTSAPGYVGFVDRTVVVTGGSRGIGRVVATRFAEDGDDVVITGRDEEQLTKAASEIGARAQRCDATVAADVQALAETVGERLDVLVNMAGANPDTYDPLPLDAPLEAVAERWRTNLELNLMTAVLTTTVFRPVFAEGAAVVNVGSIGAEHARGSYGAAKAAVAAWTVGLSSILGPRGITVNTVSPGPIVDTDFFRGTLSDERAASFVAETHTKRAGTPDDVAAAVFFLASPGARHITGQNLHVNGGAYPTR
jgi:NAD(P)-dependent dehydrogenase (short-subunit alcohol dehydrogenase family)